MKTLCRPLAVVLAAVLFLLVPAVGATAQEQTPATGDPGTAQDPSFTHSWSIGPAGSLDPTQPGNRPNLTYDVAPGTTIQDAVTLSNLGNVQLDFRVYATDALNGDDGGFELLPGEQAPNDVGSWVQVGQENITVPPGVAVTIPISITIPPDARPGDHVGGVVASSPVPGVGPDGKVLSLDRRIATRLYMRVAGPLEPRLEVQDLHVSYSPAVNPFGGEATVSYRIQNTGNVRSGGEYYVTASGPLGLMEATSDTAQLEELLPGQGYRVTTRVSGVPAAVVASATVHVTPAAIAGDTQSADPVTSGSSTFALPIGLIALLVAAGLVVFAVRRFRRHGGHGGSGQGSSGSGGGPSGTYTAAPSGAAGSHRAGARGSAPMRRIVLGVLVGPCSRQRAGAPSRRGRPPRMPVRSGARC